MVEEATMPIEKVMEKYINQEITESERKKERRFSEEGTSCSSSSLAEPCSSSASSSLEQCEDGVSSSNEAGTSGEFKWINCMFYIDYRCTKITRFAEYSIFVKIQIFACNF